MKWPSTFQLLSIAALCSISGVKAGAEANIYACVYYPSYVTDAIQVDFTPVKEAEKCMKEDKQGDKTTLIVNKGGISCAYIGDVESKASGFCLVRDSIWTLSYSSNDTYSGTIKSLWANNYAERWSKITLEDYPKGTVICPDDALCEATYYKWTFGVGIDDTPPNIYIIFKPALAALTTDNVLDSPHGRYASGLRIQGK